MGRIKGLFGERLQARSWEGQVNECYLRVAAMNRMTGLGMPVSQVVHRQEPPGIGETRPADYSCTNAGREADNASISKCRSCMAFS